MLPTPGAAAPGAAHPRRYHPPVSGGDERDEAAIIRRLEELVSPKRLLHCQRVADLAQSLALRWGLDPRLARRAGLLHDACRRPRPEWDALAEREGLTLPDWAVGEKGFLHGPLAAILAREEFGLPEDWCRAIAGHTTGGPGMTLEEMVLFVADHAAVGREEPQAGGWRELAHRDLRQAALEQLSARLGDLLVTGSALWVPTVLARNDLLLRQGPVPGASGTMGHQ
jgi:predicted HD superfamily hydrolase involved in NAD metabolism